MPPISFDFNLPPKDAIAYLEQKKLKLGFNYEEVMHEAHHTSFTVAKITNLDLLSDIHQSIIKSQRDGIPFEAWKKDLAPTLKKYGWWGETTVTDPVTKEARDIYVGSRRLRTIFDTNMRVSYSVGRYKQMMSLEEAVYWCYIAILDSRSRPKHAAKHMTVLHRDHPWWRLNYPPNAWNCRCKVRAYSLAAIEAMGYKVSTIDPENIASPDWAYDVGAGARIEKENLLYRKTLKSPFPVANALETISSLVDREAYINWAKATLADKTYPVNEVIAGVLTYEVLTFLEAKEIVPDSPHIWLSKKALTHMLRHVKKESGIALDETDIFDIADHLNTPSSILWDKDKKNVLYVFDNVKLGKIIVEVNYVSKSGVKNQIITGSILKEIPKGYEVIQ